MADVYPMTDELETLIAAWEQWIPETNKCLEERLFDLLDRYGDGLTSIGIQLTLGVSAVEMGRLLRNFERRGIIYYRPISRCWTLK